MEKKPIYPAGMSVFLPHQKAPEFVIAEISIQPQKFINFLKENKEHISDKGYFRITMKRGRDEAYYLELDTWKASASQSFNKTPDPEKTYRSSVEGTVEYPVNDRDLPF